MDTNNRYIYIAQNNLRIKSEINKQLCCTFHIIGEKILFNLKKVHIIELEDYTRIWILQEELNITVKNKVIK